MKVKKECNNQEGKSFQRFDHPEMLLKKKTRHSISVNLMYAFLPFSHSLPFE